MYELKRQPSHPGVILREEFVRPLGLTQVELAKRLKTTFRTVNEILNEKRGVSPDMALRLARFFGTSEELWLNLQDRFDLYRAGRANWKVIKGIKPLDRTKLAAG
ncbi:MAG: HigA family addiction module antidote protein [Thermodesulfovibrionales bacterium]|nr:HigA family addiction module antidote protein [Thermodesulfovibrionales bacterium]